MLVDGVWTKDWDPVQKSDDKGRFVRQDMCRQPPTAR